MKKFLMILATVLVLVSCKTTKAYNTELQQVELGMTRPQVENLMGTDYIEHPSSQSWGKTLEQIEYPGRYKLHWHFMFEDGRLVKWYKEEKK